MGLRSATVTADLDVNPDAFFRLITDVNRLPLWNDRIQRVVEGPETQPKVGDDWVVELKAMGSKWNSRSTLEAIDPERRHLALRSRTDDGNPSFAIWRWDGIPNGDGTRVTVSWEVHPKTFWRKILLSRIRHKQLKTEVRESLRKAEALLRAEKEPASS